MFSEKDIQELKNRLDDDFSVKLLVGALRVANDAENPIRGNLFASAIRELLSTTLHRLAPDTEVYECIWYRKETEDGKPTRRQRLTYLIHGGLSPDYVRDNLGIDVPSLSKSLIDTIDMLHGKTHLRENTVVFEEAEVRSLIDDSLKVFVSVLDMIDNCRNKAKEAIDAHIIDETTDHVISESIQSIDECAPHHSIEEVYIDSVKTDRIDAHYIWYKASGSVEVELQWGSSSDFRNGDGLAVPHSFPFECLIPAPVDNPKEFEISMIELFVNDGGWRDNYYDPDDI